MDKGWCEKNTHETEVNYARPAITIIWDCTLTADLVVNERHCRSHNVMLRQGYQNDNVDCWYQNSV